MNAGIRTEMLAGRGPQQFDAICGAGADLWDDDADFDRFQAGIIETRRTARRGTKTMPTVSRFFGIVIRMYFDDHRPPHFHAYYGEYAETIEIETLSTRDGKLPRRARVLVLEWAAQHQEQLLENWRRSEEHEPLQAIEPLE